MSKPATSPLRIVFVLVALGFAAAGVFHGVALFAPRIAEPAPASRHLVFVFVNFAFAAGMLARPRWFVLAFAALTLQQLWSHGAYALETWRNEARVDWASALVLVAMPLLLALLARDALKRTYK